MVGVAVSETNCFTFLVCESLEFLEADTLDFMEDPKRKSKRRYASFTFYLTLKMASSSFYFPYRCSMKIYNSVTVLMVVLLQRMK